jgi:N-methylhydantoinase A/oxoprolinase/acetone carboxylase beta subunit
MSRSDSKYIIADDVGGTCTDCVVYETGKPVRIAKAFSTPPNFANGVIDSVRLAATDMGLQLSEVLAETKLFLHGSTVVDNTILTRDGARSGLITTAGFEDTLIMTRGAYGRWSRAAGGGHQAPRDHHSPAALNSAGTDFRCPRARRQPRRCRPDA